MCLFIFLLLWLLPLEGQDFSRQGEPENPFAGDLEAVEAGRQVYVETCSPCHGATGEGGRGPSLLGSREVRRSSDSQLFHSVKNGIPGSDMPPFPFRDEKIWKVIAFVRSLAAPAIENQVPGNVAAGRALFFGKGGCQACHMIGGSGGFLGPDLTDIGTKRTLGQLREALLEPNERLAEGFEPVLLERDDGQVIKGVAKYRTNHSMRVLDEKGEMHLVRRKEMKRVRVKEKSWMPANYSERLTDAEIQNLLAFLSRQSAAERR